MIFKDRQGTNLNRKRIKIITQTPTEIIADIERADTVTEEGTPINAEVFNAFQTSINTAVNDSAEAKTNASTAYNLATSAKNTADTVSSEFNELKTSSEFLNLNYSSANADWANSSVNTLPTLFGVKATQTSNVKFFGEGSISANIVIDGDYYGADGQKKVAYMSDIYPVGSIYMSVDSTSPASIFGGSWVQLKDRFLLGAGDTYSNGTTGGEATHTLTIEEMPRHRHPEVLTDTFGNYNAYIRKIGGSDSGINYEGSWRDDLTGGQVETDWSGNGDSHNNMPPYLVVYMWKRVS